MHERYYQYLNFQGRFKRMIKKGERKVEFILDPKSPV